MGRSTFLFPEIAVVVAHVVALHNRASELPGRCAALKQDIQLAICPAFRLGKTEERPQEAAKASGCIKIRSFGAPIPCARVEHARCEYIAND